MELWLKKLPLSYPILKRPFMKTHSMLKAGYRAGLKSESLIARIFRQVEAEVLSNSRNQSLGLLLAHPEIGVLNVSFLLLIPVA